MFSPYDPKLSQSIDSNIIDELSGLISEIRDNIKIKRENIVSTARNIIH